MKNIGWLLFNQYDEIGSDELVCSYTPQVYLVKSQTQVVACNPGNRKIFGYEMPGAYSWTVDTTKKLAEAMIKKMNKMSFKISKPLDSKPKWAKYFDNRNE